MQRNSKEWHAYIQSLVKKGINIILSWKKCKKENGHVSGVSGW